MVSCSLSKCPPSHRRPRDVVRRNWSHLVSEWSPVWAVLVDHRPGIVAPTPDRLVVVSTGAGGAEWTLDYARITEVTAAQAVLYVVDDDGHCYDLTFLDTDDAGRAGRLIEEKRVAGKGATNGHAQAELIAPAWTGGRAPAPVTDAPDDDAWEEGWDDLDTPSNPAEPEDGRSDPTGTTGAEQDAGEEESPPNPQPAGADLLDGTPLPIEREVARMIARGGRPEEPITIPPLADPPAEPVVTIPAQPGPHAAESVLLVTTDTVPGRAVLAVHGDVLGVAVWPPPGPQTRIVHDVARERLAQAALRRGGNAVVGMRYGATGMVGGDVLAYGTAVTLAPAGPAVPQEGAEPDRAVAEQDATAT